MLIPAINQPFQNCKLLLQSWNYQGPPKIYDIIIFRFQGWGVAFCYVSQPFKCLNYLGYSKHITINFENHRIKTIGKSTLPKDDASNYYNVVIYISFLTGYS